MNIPIPQDIPGLITFWIFLSWIPLLRAVTISVLNKYDELEEENDADFSDNTNRMIII